jgi:hypothetical protein
MNTASIIQEIDAEISRLQQVIAILGGVATKRGPRHPKTTEAASITGADEPTKRVLSAEARAKIAAAQKARWAKSKRADKKAAKKAASAEVPAKTLAKKSVKAAKPVKGTKPAKEDKPATQS